MRSDISKRSRTATTVCSPKRVVCHRVAGVPSQRHKGRAEGLLSRDLPLILQISHLSVSFRVPEWGDLYTLSSRRESCLFESVQLTLFPTQSPNIYRWRGKSSSAEGSVRISLCRWWIHLKKKKSPNMKKKQSDLSTEWSLRSKICDWAI